ncbi:hypothetical protein PR003_g26384 [Phytophthora rubi]|uniref:Uncharacterized protein n=1 Tax=Phytophthora rubi TaxID=129364 RepID=A0A6A3I5E8_9STRA|nr:hypothetical protein PR002_g25257 [Phytophthora rubi]KAE8977361.1 hypothetical protein PR001_g25151 [Phytophthora rubi]KAE9286191.1 hypothetical protein PR003_g26384 [Phytophthora rubi]
MPAACYGLGKPGLVSSDHWKSFRLHLGNEFEDGVFSRDIDAFFNFIRSEGVGLDYVELFKVYQNKSMWSSAQTSRSRATCPSAPVMFYNDYKEDAKPGAVVQVAVDHACVFAVACGTATSQASASAEEEEGQEEQGLQ